MIFDALIPATAMLSATLDEAEELAETLEPEADWDDDEYDVRREFAETFAVMSPQARWMLRCCVRDLGTLIAHAQS